MLQKCDVCITHYSLYYNCSFLKVLKIMIPMIYILACSNLDNPNIGNGPKLMEPSDDTNEPTIEPTNEPTNEPTDETGTTGGSTVPQPDAEPEAPIPQECPEGPVGSFIATNYNCEYTPNPSGLPFSVQVEWSMAHEVLDPQSQYLLSAYDFGTVTDTSGNVYDDMYSVFQAPAVGQLTDDNNNGNIESEDTPDIAVLMGSEFNEQQWSVLRLISGDGSKIHDTIGWSSYNGQQYAPALFGGLAIGDLENDGSMEIITMVTDTTQQTCYPAIYDISLNGSLTLQKVSSDTLFCYDQPSWTTSIYHSSHAPALADINGQGNAEIIYGNRVYDSNLNLQWEGSGGAGWYHLSQNSDWSGYWNSGYHSFAYDLDGISSNMEIVAGNTVYDSYGNIYCTLGTSSQTYNDGYPAVADIVTSSIGPEIVLTGNQKVSIFSSQSVGGVCNLIDEIENSPYNDSSLSLPTHPFGCDTSRKSFGGQPTIADFTGDGTLEIGVSGACWYTIFDVSQMGILDRYAMAPTKDWSSASTGSTVFDFNGDNSAEIVFSDENNLYVWGIDTSWGLNPWDRFITYLEDNSHKSWTIHEYPLVADLDGDGKAEILVVNSENPDYREHYGLYVLGAANDDWVSARSWWNQHAYFVTNIDDYGEINSGASNFTTLNSFRQQEPGSFGALAATDLFLYQEDDICQIDCSGEITLWLQVGNKSNYITGSAGLFVSIYGVSGNSRTLITSKATTEPATPGRTTDGISFSITNWQGYDYLVAVVDDPMYGPESWGKSKECDESNNELIISINTLCQ